MASNTSTARVAPTGSITMPSHLRIAPTGGEGRTWRRSGWMTVGPVTTRIAPNSRAIGQESPSTTCAPSVERTQQTRAPIEVRLRMTAPPRCSSRSRSERPPSKRMTATEIETIGKSSRPSSASGSR